MINNLIVLIKKLYQLAISRKGSFLSLIIFLLVFFPLVSCQLLPVLTPIGTASSSSLTATASSSQDATSESGSAYTSSTELTTTGPTDPTTGPTITDPTSSAAITSQTPNPSATAKSTTAAPKPSATSKSTTAAPTIRPTSTTAPKPTATPVPDSGSFPYKNYGTFFRDNYGSNSTITASEDGGILIDTGSTANGVVLVDIIGIPAEKRCKVIASANGKTYQYDIVPRNKYMGIPLQMGNGSYSITVYEQVSGTSYTPKMAHTFTVTLISSVKPFTAASIMTDFSRGSACVQKANSLCSGINTANGKVSAVYSWIVSNIDYDRALANSITSGQVTTYIPNPDNTYSTRKGICFDYASLMCAMLRSQGIPTRLVVGQSSLGYHAWNEVFFEGQGWVIVASFRWAEINGSGWVLFDSTFAASGMSPESIQASTHTKQKIY